MKNSFVPSMVSDIDMNKMCKVNKIINPLGKYFN